MPEEISHEPAIYPQLRNHKSPDLPFPSELKYALSPEETSEQYFQQIEKVMGKVMGEVKREFQDKVPESQIEMLGDFYFAPFRSEHGEVIDEDQKELNARIQHTLTHNILYAASSDVDPNYAANVYDTIGFYEKLAQSSLGKHEHIKQFWNGVKSEVAVVHMLRDLGYRVFLPDYSQDPWEVGEEENEVLQWDVRNGVDFIAEDEGRVLLIDSKGTKFIKRNNYSEIIERSLVEIIPGAEYYTRNRDNLNLLPPVLRSAVSPLNPSDVRRMTIIVPTSGKYLNTLPPTANHSKRGSSELERFATLIDPRARADFSVRLLNAA